MGNDLPQMLNTTPPIDLDAWMPDPQICTRHRREAHAAVDDLWAAASSVRLDDARTLGRIVRWRIPGLPGDRTFRAMFACEPFTLLAEGDTWSASGLVGRIWSVRRDYPRVGTPQEFDAWDGRGTARVLFAHWVEPTADGRSALMSEARVKPVDKAASLRLRALWTVVAPFERLIGGEALALAADRAEHGVAARR